MKIVEIIDRNIWDAFVITSPWGHPLQLWGWGETKVLNGWQPYRLALMDGGTITAGVQVLLWQLPKLSSYIVYAPRGPVVEPSSSLSKELMGGLTEWAAGQKALYVRIEPAWIVGAPTGWIHAQNTLQMAATYTINLRKDEVTLQEAMSRKHRQYIRKAERDGVSVARVPKGKIGNMYELYCETAMRAGFGIHSKEYYEKLSTELGDQSNLFEARVDGISVAFLWLAVAGKTAYELYGGVNGLGAEMKSNYILKWEAIRAMKADGYKIYDFNGRLNEGVSRFKDGFGPDETNYIGTYDLPLNRLGYEIWEHAWPVAKRIGRLLRRAKG